MLTALSSSVYLDILQDRSEPVLYEEDDWFILLAKRPCNEGHMLIVPKIQTPKFYDLPEEILERGFLISSKISKMLDEMYEPPRVAFFVKGFTNDDHAHIHVTPAYKSEDLDKDLTRPELTTDQMEQISFKLEAAIQKTLVVT